jgi:transcriptional regulator with AAA-type ATPase domain
MNRKEKNIVRGYLNAVKYASHLESRVRVMLIGDTGSGKEGIEGCMGV